MNEAFCRVISGIILYRTITYPFCRSIVYKSRYCYIYLSYSSCRNWIKCNCCIWLFYYRIKRTVYTYKRVSPYIWTDKSKYTVACRSYILSNPVNLVFLYKSSVWRIFCLFSHNRNWIWKCYSCIVTALEYVIYILFSAKFTFKIECRICKARLSVSVFSCLRTDCIPAVLLCNYRTAAFLCSETCCCRQVFRCRIVIVDDKRFSFSCYMRLSAYRILCNKVYAEYSVSASCLKFIYKTYSLLVWWKCSPSYYIARCVCCICSCNCSAYQFMISYLEIAYHILIRYGSGKIPVSPYIHWFCIYLFCCCTRCINRGHILEYKILYLRCIRVYRYPAFLVLAELLVLIPCIDSYYCRIRLWCNSCLRLWIEFFLPVYCLWPWWIWYCYICCIVIQTLSASKASSPCYTAVLFRGLCCIIFLSVEYLIFTAFFHVIKVVGCKVKVCYISPALCCSIYVFCMCLRNYLHPYAVYSGISIVFSASLEVHCSSVYFKSSSYCRSVWGRIAEFEGRLVALRIHC